MKPQIHSASRHPVGVVGLEAFTFESDRCFPRHSHDQFGIGVVLAGAQRSWSGVGHVEASAGDVISVNPGEMHDGSPIGAAARRWRMIYFEPEALARLFAGEASGSLEFETPCSRDRTLAARVNSLFAALLREGSGMALEEALFRSAFRMLVRTREPERLGVNAANLSRSLQRIRDDVTAPLALSDLAAEAGLSRFQFLRAFTKAVGATPHAYILQLRARLARRRIDRGDSLAEAALASGFADQSHMTRAFVRQFGFPPGQYARSRG